jgi:hypothetical protein
MVVRSDLHQKIWMWWHKSVITTKKEIEVGRSQFETGLRQKVRLYLKNNLKQKELEVWIK